MTDAVFLPLPQPEMLVADVPGAERAAFYLDNDRLMSAQILHGQVRLSTAAPVDCAQGDEWDTYFFALAEALRSIVAARVALELTPTA